MKNQKFEKKEDKFITETKSMFEGFEGYGPRLDGEEGCQLYGYPPVPDKFSLLYELKDEKSNKKVTFSFFIDKTDAVYIEDIMLREEANRSISSQTYYGEGIYMTCISGSYPIISIPKKGFSFRFYDNEDYDRFQKILIGFLDKTYLDDELQKLRNDLKKNREKKKP